MVISLQWYEKQIDVPGPVVSVGDVADHHSEKLGVEDCYQDEARVEGRDHGVWIGEKDHRVDIGEEDHEVGTGEEDRRIGIGGKDHGIGIGGRDHGIGIGDGDCWLLLLT